MRKKKYERKFFNLTRFRKKEDVEDILFGIYLNKEKSGWTNWHFFDDKFANRQNLAIIQELEEKNVIVQREGRFEWVKLKNGLVEEIIQEKLKSKS